MNNGNDATDLPTAGDGLDPAGSVQQIVEHVDVEFRTVPGRLPADIVTRFGDRRDHLEAVLREGSERLAGGDGVDLLRMELEIEN
ncbi:hypothetical protein BRC68_16900 [Halobacteriales archaeon QH_6_64_20]|nr:MAG: hypothetical protein BRC68_16900 [Halobacteriales archaeon QH_6_64_20]